MCQLGAGRRKIDGVARGQGHRRIEILVETHGDPTVCRVALLDLGSQELDRSPPKGHRLRSEEQEVVVRVQAKLNLRHRRILSGSNKLVQERLGLLQVGRVETLGEPAIDRGNQITCLGL